LLRLLDQSVYYAYAGHKLKGAHLGSFQVWVLPVPTQSMDVLQDLV
jgi:hypothetical protein